MFRKGCEVRGKALASGVFGLTNSSDGCGILECGCRLLILLSKDVDRGSFVVTLVFVFDVRHCVDVEAGIVFVRRRLKGFPANLLKVSPKEDLRLTGAGRSCCIFDDVAPALMRDVPSLQDGRRVSPKVYRETSLHSSLFASLEARTSSVINPRNKVYLSYH